MPDPVAAARGRARRRRRRAGRRSTGPQTPTHGDYATNVALQLAGRTRRPPREIAEELVRAAAAVDGVAQATVAGPGFVNLELDDSWFVRGARERARGGRRTSAAAPPPTPERVQVEMVSANPTGPMTVAVGPQRRLRRLRRPAARVRRPHGRARVLLQRRRRADGPLPRLGRGRPSRRGAARGRLPRRLHRRARDGSTATPCRACSA